MRYAQYFAIASVLVLLLSVTLSRADAVGQPTSISIEVSASKVNVGDTVTFSGSLVDARTGEGIEGKTITIYKEGPIGPVPFMTATTGIDGGFSVDWIADLERNSNTPITMSARFDGDSQYLPSRTGKTSFTVALKPLELVITTDGNKNKYFLGDKALISVALSDGSANFVDPDFLRATYDGRFVEMKKEDVGRYTFQTPQLVKFEQHQFGVFAEKWGYKSTQQSITITTFGVKGYKPMKVAASITGDDVRIIVRNGKLSPNNMYTFTGTFVGGIPISGSAKNWIFSVDPATNSFSFKTIEGFLPPGKMIIFKVKVDGEPTKLSWKAFDLHGKEHSTVRNVTDSGATAVKPIRAR